MMRIVFWLVAGWQQQEEVTVPRIFTFQFYGM
jgi:hypothetical protein